MTNILKEAMTFPVSITKAAYKIATWAHIGAFATSIGQIAQVVAAHQPLLNVIFGSQKGALAAIACTAVAQAATLVTAHGQPLNPEADALNAVFAVAEPLLKKPAPPLAQPPPGIVPTSIQTPTSATLPLATPPEAST